jgi:hypothetical protein
VKVLAGSVKRNEARGRAGFERDVAPGRCMLAIQAPEPCAAIRSIAAGMTRLELPVEPDKTKLLPIFPEQGALAGRQIKQIDIVPARVAVVEAHSNLVGDDTRPVRRHRPDVGKGREIAQFAIAGIDHEQMQVFIAVLIVEKHDVATVRAPGLPGDRPALGACDRLPCRDVVNWRHPDIEHAISRGKP